MMTPEIKQVYALQNKYFPSVKGKAQKIIKFIYRKLRNCDFRVVLNIARSLVRRVLLVLPLLIQLDFGDIVVL